jgi:hypothetical protein
MAGPGAKLLRRLQIGKESTPGSAVPATTMWRGLGMIEDTRDFVFVDENVGYLSGVNRAYQPKLEARFSMESTPATFEQLPYVFDAGIHADTAAADGTGSGYVYAYVAHTTANPDASTLEPLTIEGGDNIAAEEMEYSFPLSFQLDGAGGQAWMLSAEWVGRQCSTSTFTTGLSLPTVEECLFSNTILYVDSVTGSVGTTPQTSTFLAATLNWTTGWIPVYGGHGAKTFEFAKHIGAQITLDVTYEHDAFSTAQKDAWRANTPKQIRLLCIGTALTTAGTYTHKSLIIDLAGKWEKFDKIGELNGNDVLKGRFVAGYDATAALFAEILVVNSLAAMP